MTFQELERNAARYLWLKARLLAADFAYGDPSEACCALVFEIPEDMSVSADLDATIDDAPGNAGIRTAMADAALNDAYAEGRKDEREEMLSKLRDEFAAAAIMKLSTDWQPESAARLAYQLADAMLVARALPKAGESQ